MRKLFGLLFVVSFVIWSCGSEDDRPHTLSVEAKGAQEDGAASVNAFTSSYKKELCALNKRCDAGLFSSDYSLCVMQVAVPSAAQARALSFDSVIASACIQFLRGFDCADTNLLAMADPSLLEERCGRALEGRAGAGEYCNSAFECKGFAYCDMSQCPGTCVSLRSGSCGGCDRGEYCEEEELSCKAMRGLSEVCPKGYECLDGLRCVDGICVRGGTGGESCASVPCAEGWECVQDTVTCTGFVFGQREGEDCGGIYVCGNDLRCDSLTKTCVSKSDFLPDTIECVQ